MEGLARVVFLAILFVNKVESYGTGAPLETRQDVCGSMIPGHREIEVQNGTSPYTVSILDDAMHYSRGNSVRVNIKGTEPFKGFLLIAKRVDDGTIVGRFSSPPMEAQLKNCWEIDDNAATHNNKTLKNDLTFTWYPPYTDQGEIEFIATIAQTKEKIWLQQKSATLSYGGGTDICSKDPGTAGLSVVAIMVKQVNEMKKTLEKNSRTIEALQQQVDALTPRN